MEAIHKVMLHISGWLSLKEYTMFWVGPYKSTGKCRGVTITLFSTLCWSFQTDYMKLLCFFQFCFIFMKWSHSCVGGAVQQQSSDSLKRIKAQKNETFHLPSRQYKASLITTPPAISNVKILPQVCLLLKHEEGNACEHDSLIMSSEQWITAILYREKKVLDKLTHATSCISRTIIQPGCEWATIWPGPVWT